MSQIYKKIFNSDPQLLPDIEEFILDIVNKLSLAESVRNNVELAVAEAAANSILHGNKGNKNKSVQIRLEASDNELSVSFTDEGKGFDIKEVPDPTIPENILRGSGRGIHIMKNLADHLEYNFSEEGTEVVLKFNI